MKSLNKRGQPPVPAGVYEIVTRRIIAVLPGYTGRKGLEMRITKDRISFVKEFVQDGITFHWFVGTKDRKVSSSRSYINYENGLSVIADYSSDRLPKCVQKFISEHERVLQRNTYGVDEYIYQ